MDIYLTLCIILGAICLILICVLVPINSKLSKTLRALKNRETDNVEEKNGVRYTVDQSIVGENGEVNVSLGTKDVVLPEGERVVVAKNSKVKPGKYTLLTTIEEKGTFSLMVGSYLREFKHGDSVVFHAGEEICAVNCAIILRWHEIFLPKSCF